MFITLKSSSDGHADPEMEQVASRRASGHTRPSRRPACAACQKRKLRCTGSLHECDRCIARAISCIPASRTTRNSTKAHDNEGHSAMPATLVLDGGMMAQPEAATTVQSSVNGSALADNSPSSLNSTMSSLHIPSSQGLFSFLPNELFSQPDQSPTARFWQLPDTPETVPATDSSSSSLPACTCVEGALGVVQQLDDDSFRLSLLSFDEVIQLQKWIMCQCCKPLDCAKCSGLSTALTVLVLICDRLTEMFECIRVRVIKAARLLPSGGLTQPVFLDHSVQNSNANALLFSADGSGSAGSGSCNPELFSTGFRDLYSSEEQVHMIRALLTLQIRNFRGLLGRIDAANQIQASEARRQKLKSLGARLEKAQGDIEYILQAATCH